MKNKRDRSVRKTDKDSAQIERFKQTARELECDESGEVFRRALGRILPSRVPGQALPQDRPRPHKGSRRKPGDDDR